MYIGWVWEFKAGVEPGGGQEVGVSVKECMLRNASLNLPATIIDQKFGVLLERKI